MAVMPQTLQWFEAGGTKFNNAFATTPLCCPSRASIFSGRYTHNHGVATNDSAAVLDQRFTIQAYLKAAGYRTGMFGKYFNAWNLFRNPPSFDDWAIFTAGYSPYPRERARHGQDHHPVRDLVHPRQRGELHRGIREPGRDAMVPGGRDDRSARALHARHPVRRTRACRPTTRIRRSRRPTSATSRRTSRPGRFRSRPWSRDAREPAAHADVRRRHGPDTCSRRWRRPARRRTRSRSSCRTTASCGGSTGCAGRERPTRRPCACRCTRAGPVISRPVRPTTAWSRTSTSRRRSWTPWAGSPRGSRWTAAPCSTRFRTARAC